MDNELIEIMALHHCDEDSEAEIKGAADAGIALTIFTCRAVGACDECKVIGKAQLTAIEQAGYRITKETL